MKEKKNGFWSQSSVLTTLAHISSPYPGYRTQVFVGSYYLSSCIISQEARTKPMDAPVTHIKPVRFSSTVSYCH